MDELLDDILALVLYGALDAEYITGKTGNLPFDLLDSTENEEKNENDEDR